MGADLTIVDTGRYFRDSYNHWNSWWNLGLSYWEMSEKLRPHINEEGVLSYEGVRIVAEAVSKTKFNREKVLAKYKEDAAKYGWKESNDSLNRYAEDMEKRDREMRMFWSEAVRRKSGVQWSV